MVALQGVTVFGYTDAQVKNRATDVDTVGTRAIQNFQIVCSLVSGSSSGGMTLEFKRRSLKDISPPPPLKKLNNVQDSLCGSVKIQVCRFAEAHLDMPSTPSTPSSGPQLSRSVGFYSSWKTPKIM